jgi:hypothetical protein
MTSDSSLVSSTIRLVKALFTKTLFQPVTAVNMSTCADYQGERGCIGVWELTVGANDWVNGLQRLSLIQL